MDSAKALQIAERFVLDRQREAGVELAILTESTIEFGCGCVFFYDSKKHIESGSISDAIAGNAPVIVSKLDGSLHETGTALPIEHYIRDFERSCLR